MVGGLWSAWLFWFFEALVCVSGKTKCAKCVGKKFLFLCVGYFLFFSVSDCCLVRCRSVGSGGRSAIATNLCIGLTKSDLYNRFWVDWSDKRQPLLSISNILLNFVPHHRIHLLPKIIRPPKLSQTSRDYF